MTDVRLKLRQGRRVKDYQVPDGWGAEKVRCELRTAGFRELVRAEQDYGPVLRVSLTEVMEHGQGGDSWYLPGAGWDATAEALKNAGFDPTPNVPGAGDAPGPSA